MWTKFGALHADCGVDIPHLKTVLSQQVDCSSEEDCGVNSFKLRRCVGKVQPDISQCRSTEEGIAYGMYENIAIRVGYATASVWYDNATERQGQPLLKPVYVISFAYSYLHSLWLKYNAFDDYGTKIAYFYQIFISFVKKLTVSIVMQQISTLEPTIVWEIFQSITQVPRPSMKEGKILAWLKEFAKSHALSCKQDAAGNILISAPATAGRENSPHVTLQAHVDMVCEKDSDVEFDFESDPIKTRIEGDWVTAVGTTLGADCGIGMAAALAALIDTTYEHGAISALFTVNEEVGLTGAFELGEGMIDGKLLINLDSEEEGEICIGCAGGIDTVATFTYEEEEAPADFSFFRVDISGLLGGHSGQDINAGRANANILLARLMGEAMSRYNMHLSYMSGGNLRNAIPREAYAIFGIPSRFEVEFRERVDLFRDEIADEFGVTEPDFALSLGDMPRVKVIDKASQEGVIYSMLGLPNGVIAMSAVMDNMV